MIPHFADWLRDTFKLRTECDEYCERIQKESEKTATLIQGVDEQHAALGREVARWSGRADAANALLQAREKVLGK